MAPPSAWWDGSAVCLVHDYFLSDNGNGDAESSNECHLKTHEHRHSKETHTHTHTQPDQRETKGGDAST